MHAHIKRINIEVNIKKIQSSEARKFLFGKIKIVL